MIKRIFLAALAIATLSISLPAGAEANTPAPPKGVLEYTKFFVHVRNTSKTCVWVSVGYSLPGQTWKWMGDARFIRPGESYQFGAPELFNLAGYDGQVKVEGTFMAHADCSGGHAMPAITTINKNIRVQRYGRAKATGVLSGDSTATYRVEVLSDV